MSAVGQLVRRLMVPEIELLSSRLGRVQHLRVAAEAAGFDLDRDWIEWDDRSLKCAIVEQVVDGARP